MVRCGIMIRNCIQTKLPSWNENRQKQSNKSEEGVAVATISEINNSN